MQHSLTPIDGLLIFERARFEDQRGSFERVFCSDTLDALGGMGGVSQANLSRTLIAGSIRGMHLQLAPECEKKLVTCNQGRIFDVTVDMRLGSPTFLQHFHIELCSGDTKSLLIPEGVAHGFQSLSNNSELIYFHSRNYSPEYELGFNPFDPAIDIHWPLAVSDISDKDANHKFISSDFKGLTV